MSELFKSPATYLLYYWRLLGHNG